MSHSNSDSVDHKSNESEKVSRRTKKFKRFKPSSIVSVNMTSTEAEQETRQDDISEMTLTIDLFKAMVSKPDREVAQLSGKEKFDDKILKLGYMTNIEALFARLKKNYED
jgi:hypothetical protein